MTRAEIIQEMVRKYRGNMIQAFQFENEEIPYIMYDYDEESDSFVAGGVSIPFHYDLDKIDVNLIDKTLEELEGLLMEHYQNNLGITLIYPDD